MVEKTGGGIVCYVSCGHAKFSASTVHLYPVRRRPCFAKSCGAGHDPPDSDSFHLAPPCARNFALNFSCSLVQWQIWRAVQECFLHQRLTSAVRMRI